MAPLMLTNPAAAARSFKPSAVTTSSSPSPLARPVRPQQQPRALTLAQTRPTTRTLSEAAVGHVLQATAVDVPVTTHASSEVSTSGADLHVRNAFEAASTSAAPSTCTLLESSQSNAVTIKSTTKVKDAAGAIVKVLDRIQNTFVTALRLDSSHDSLNRAIKSIAVARKYIKDSQPDSELVFLPLNRSNAKGQQDPNLFAFLVFKIPHMAGLLEHDVTDLNVSRNSDPNSMANAVIKIIKERGQAVMKAGGSAPIFVAMSAIVNARQRLKRNYNTDIMLVPAWITEDTTATLGRESKFVRFNILPCAVNGPVQEATPVHPSMSSYEGSLSKALAAAACSMPGASEPQL